MTREERATHRIANLILVGYWSDIRAISLCLLPTSPETVKAAQDALGIYYNYLGYDPKETLL